MDSPFLRDFMRMRQSIGKPVTPVAPQGITFATIIEKKPPAKVVLEYFKKRCDELSDS